MFGLIRRKASPSFDRDDGAFESTTFSLSTSVPRPTERRGGERVLPTLCIVKLIGRDGEQLMRARNVSAGGMMCDSTAASARNQVSAGAEGSCVRSSATPPAGSSGPWQSAQ